VQCAYIISYIYIVKYTFARQFARDNEVPRLSYGVSKAYTHNLMNTCNICTTMYILRANERLFNDNIIVLNMVWLYILSDTRLCTAALCFPSVQNRHSYTLSDRLQSMCVYMPTFCNRIATVFSEFPKLDNISYNLCLTSQSITENKNDCVK